MSVVVPRTIDWDDDGDLIRFIDQTRLPHRLHIVRCTSVQRLMTAIKRLEVRGAPALGVAGGFGVALAASRCRLKGRSSFLARVEAQGNALAKTRPTAINLSWGVFRVLQAVKEAGSVQEMKAAAVHEALAIAREDEACCHAIGDHGAALLPDTATVLTHCNAGSLACSAYGTALGVIRSAAMQGKQVKVFACETRPLLQGARLTAWELAEDGIDVTVITDSMAAGLMRKKTIDCVIVGADRITKDAVFNKIGTYMHAVCAAHHAIPFYVAAPLSTFDPVRTEKDVTVEERARDEIAGKGVRSTVPAKAKVYNPSFDATPLGLVTAIITEEAVLSPPFDMKALISRRTIP